MRGAILGNTKGVTFCIRGVVLGERILAISFSKRALRGGILFTVSPKIRGQILEKFLSFFTTKAEAKWKRNFNLNDIEIGTVQAVLRHERVGCNKVVHRGVDFPSHRYCHIREKA